VDFESSQSSHNNTAGYAHSVIWVLIGIGGGLGAIARHGLNALIHGRLVGVRFPVGIFAVNVLGSFAIGLLGGLIASERLSDYPSRTFLIVGVLGGFTTFSSFSFDTLALVRQGLSLQAFWNVIGQVGLSLAAVWLGFSIGISKTGAL
jgi:fluoride exporter